MDLRETLKKALYEAGIKSYSIESENDLNDKLEIFKSNLSEEFINRNNCNYKDFKIIININENEHYKVYKITVYLLSKKLQNRYKNNGATIEFKLG